MLGICKGNKRLSRGRRRCCCKQEGELLSMRDIPSKQNNRTPKEGGQTLQEKSTSESTSGKCVESGRLWLFCTFGLFVCAQARKLYSYYLLAERKQLASVLSDALKWEHYFCFAKHCSYLLALFWKPANVGFLLRLGKGLELFMILSLHMSYI